jgi:hypothetical protein
MSIPDLGFNGKLAGGYGWRQRHWILRRSLAGGHGASVYIFDLEREDPAARHDTSAPGPAWQT